MYGLNYPVLKHSLHIQVYDEMKEKEPTMIAESGSFKPHGSTEDLSDKGSLAVIEFTATSVAVLEKEQKCKVHIRRYGRKDNSVAFR